MMQMFVAILLMSLAKGQFFFNSRMDEIQTFKVLVIAVNQIESS